MGRELMNREGLKVTRLQWEIQQTTDLEDFLFRDLKCVDLADKIAKKWCHASSRQEFAKQLLRENDLDTLEELDRKGEDADEAKCNGILRAFEGKDLCQGHVCPYPAFQRRKATRRRLPPVDPDVSLVPETQEVNALGKPSQTSIPTVVWLGVFLVVAFFIYWF